MTCSFQKFLAKSVKKRNLKGVGYLFHKPTQNVNSYDVEPIQSNQDGSKNKTTNLVRTRD